MSGCKWYDEQRGAPYIPNALLTLPYLATPCLSQKAVLSHWVPSD